MPWIEFLGDGTEDGQDLSLEMDVNSAWPPAEGFSMYFWSKGSGEIRLRLHEGQFNCSSNRVKLFGMELEPNTRSERYEIEDERYRCFLLTISPSMGPSIDSRISLYRDGQLLKSKSGRVVRQLRRKLVWHIKGIDHPHLQALYMFKMEMSIDLVEKIYQLGPHYNGIEVDKARTNAQFVGRFDSPVYMPTYKCRSSPRLVSSTSRLSSPTTEIHFPKTISEALLLMGNHKYGSSVIVYSDKPSRTITREIHIESCASYKVSRRVVPSDVKGAHRMYLPARLLAIEKDGDPALLHYFIVLLESQENTEIAQAQHHMDVLTYILFRRAKLGYVQKDTIELLADIGVGRFRGEDENEGHHFYEAVFEYTLLNPKIWKMASCYGHLLAVLHRLCFEEPFAERFRERILGTDVVSILCYAFHCNWIQQDHLEQTVILLQKLCLTGHRQLCVERLFQTLCFTAMSEEDEWHKIRYIVLSCLHRSSQSEAVRKSGSFAEYKDMLLCILLECCFGMHPVDVPSAFLVLQFYLDIQKGHITSGVDSYPLSVVSRCIPLMIAEDQGLRESIVHYMMQLIRDQRLTSYERCICLLSAVYGVSARHNASEALISSCVSCLDELMHYFEESNDFRIPFYRLDRGRDRLSRALQDVCLWLIYIASGEHPKLVRGAIRLLTVLGLDFAMRNTGKQSYSVVDFIVDNCLEKSTRDCFGLQFLTSISKAICNDSHSYFVRKEKYIIAIVHKIVSKSHLQGENRVKKAWWIEETSFWSLGLKILHQCMECWASPRSTTQSKPSIPASPLTRIASLKSLIPLKGGEGTKDILGVYYSFALRAFRVDREEVRFMLHSISKDWEIIDKWAKRGEGEESRLFFKHLSCHLYFLLSSEDRDMINEVMNLYSLLLKNETSHEILRSVLQIPVSNFNEVPMDLYGSLDRDEGFVLLRDRRNFIKFQLWIGSLGDEIRNAMDRAFEAQSRDEWEPYRNCYREREPSSVTGQNVDVKRKYLTKTWAKCREYSSKYRSMKLSIQRKYTDHFLFGKRQFETLSEGLAGKEVFEEEDGVWVHDRVEGLCRTRKKLMLVNKDETRHSIFSGGGQRMTAEDDIMDESIIDSIVDEEEVDELDEREKATSVPFRLLFRRHARKQDKERISLNSYLVPGDKIKSTFQCDVIAGMGSVKGIFILGHSHCYLIDQLSSEGNRTHHDAGESDRDLQQGQENLSHARARSFTSFTSLNTLHRRSMMHACRNWPYESITGIHKMRYLLREVSIEVFFVDGEDLLVAFETKDIMEDVFATLIDDCRLQNQSCLNIRERIQSLCDDWVMGRISNFEYLMQLNTAAGRSCNDLTQYPIYPWIFRDYHSQDLDLNDPSVYRDLSKPMGILNRNREESFRSRYRLLQQAYMYVLCLFTIRATNDLIRRKGDTHDPPFHYGTHYSTASIVLYYLVRLEPYAELCKILQGGKFDQPDRLFRSMHETWLASSGNIENYDNTQDVKELIPEFFYLPSFLLNLNRYDFGQTAMENKVVGDVDLPPWCNGNVFEFILLHQKGLESEYVSAHLHEWIDLIFGYKQTGKDAVEACNVFYHMTYEGALDLDKVECDEMKEAYIQQILDFGQIPKQLFRTPHPRRRVLKPRFCIDPQPFMYPSQNVRASLGKALQPLEREEGGRRLFVEYDGRDIGTRTRVIQSGDDKGPINDIACDVYNRYMFVRRKARLARQFADCVIAWGYADYAIRILRREKHCRDVGYKKSDAILTIDSDHPICWIDVSPDGSLLFWSTDTMTDLGCCVTVTRIVDNRIPSEMEPQLSMEVVGRLVSPLHRGRIIAGSSSTIHSLVVTICSEGRNAMLWDLKRLRLVRYIAGRPLVWTQSIPDVSIDEYYGHVAITAEDVVFVASVNGDVLATKRMKGVKLSSVEWIRSRPNDYSLLATGCLSGDVHLYRMTNTVERSMSPAACNLDPFFKIDALEGPITTMYANLDGTTLYTGHRNGAIVEHTMLEEGPRPGPEPEPEPEPRIEKDAIT